MILWIMFGIVLLPVLLIFLSHFIVEKSTEKFVFNDVEMIPENRVGLILGTAKYLSVGRINLYYKYRIEAADKLYKAGKIKKILISGDNSRNSYNEPKLMKEDLVALGIPKEDIYLDYAGFRTLDSVVRAKKVFGQNSFTVISQEFHNERAIYIARENGLEANGFNAKDVTLRAGFKVVIREYLARVKMMIDLHLINKQPKFLGEEIEII